MRLVNKWTIAPVIVVMLLFAALAFADPPCPKGKLPIDDEDARAKWISIWSGITNDKDFTEEDLRVRTGLDRAQVESCRERGKKFDPPGLQKEKNKKNPNGNPHS